MTKSNGKTLFSKVSKASSESIYDGMVKADDISDDDIEQNKKIDDYAFEKAIKNIKLYAIYVIGGFIAFIVLVFFIILSMLSIKYTSMIFDRPEKIEQLLGTVATYILGVLSTITIAYFKHILVDINVASPLRSTA